MKIVWDVQSPMFEERFVNEWLFDGWQVEKSHRADQPVTQEDLLIVSGLRESRKAVVKRLGPQSPFAAYLLLSDEQLIVPFRPFRKARLLIRNYFRPGWGNRRVFSIPLGFHGDFVDQREDGGRRDLSWAFAGQIKRDRKAMLESLRMLPQHLVALTSSWADQNGMTGAEVRALYARAHFVPCPFGNMNPDSFRVMEALESGAIPMVLLFKGEDYFRFIYGDHPFLVGSTWKELASKMAGLLDNPQKLAETHHEIWEWYRHYTGTLRSDVRALVSGGPVNLAGEQWSLQRRARFNPRLRLLFWWHFTARRRRTVNAIRRIIDGALHGLGLGR
jgi:hypothetical protein